jgi:hypothetical protein
LLIDRPGRGKAAGLCRHRRSLILGAARLSARQGWARWLIALICNSAIYSVNRVLDADNGLAQILHVPALVFLRRSARNFATMRNLATARLRPFGNMGWDRGSAALKSQITEFTAKNKACGGRGVR